MIEETLGRLAAGEDLSMDDMARAVEAIMQAAKTGRTDVFRQGVWDSYL